MRYTENEKYLSDFLEIIILFIIILDACFVYELNSHHQVARHLIIKKNIEKKMKKEIIFELHVLPAYSKATSQWLINQI